jgi:hypothetical protein
MYVRMQKNHVNIIYIQYVYIYIQYVYNIDRIYIYGLTPSYLKMKGFQNF